MKTKDTRFGLHRLMLLLAIVGVLAAMALPSLVHAQDASSPVATAPASLDAASGEIAAPAATSALSLAQGLTALVVPVVVFGVRKLVPSLPKGWLPVIAAGLGALSELIGAIATGASANVWLGLLLGLAGVGVREASKQLKTAAAPAA